MTTIKTTDSPECILIGTNLPSIEAYASTLTLYGKKSEAYRDLRMSFIDYNGKKMSYMDLLNKVVLEEQSQENEPLFKSGDIPALAAVYLTHFLRKRGVRAEYINLFEFEKGQLKKLLAQNPLCVAITTTFYVINNPVIEIVEFIRKHSDNVKIIVGGPLIANHAFAYKGSVLFKMLDNIGADIYVIESQGETALMNVMEGLRAGSSLKDTPNIIFKNGDGQYITTPTVHENNCLNENYIDWKRFSDYDLGPTIQIRTARSCAFKCSFCSYPARAGKLTLASVDTIMKELDSIHNIGTVKNIVFIDDTFNVPLPRFKNICREIIKRGYFFEWYSYFRCSNTDEEAVALMAESGCRGVFLGFESASPSILRNMDKAATFEQYKRGMEWLKEYNILTFGSFIIGFPGETNATVQDTVDFIKQTKPDYYRLAMWFNKNTAPILKKKDIYEIKGNGFKWSHNTMNSMEAIDHVERLFLEIEESIWMPQWSFDFWHIPYLFQKGISGHQLKEFMTLASDMLKLDVRGMPENEKYGLQRSMVNAYKLSKTIEPIRMEALTGQ